jgi:eukaryotic-like serine/threonine-protein kinase
MAGPVGMTPGRWEQIERIYQEAAAKPAAERPLFLDEACAGDAELRAEVERMLSCASDAGGFLESPAVEVAARVLAGGSGALSPGSHLGPYEIVSLAGVGGMGEVWKARDPRLKRFVALKVLPRELVADPERKQRLVREARAASALNHAHIVTVYEIGQAGGVDFIAMEYVEGKTLEEEMGRRGLKLSDALKVAVQIADALAKAHAAGIVHRDLKPGNVMVTADGRVKLLDFGLAKLTEAAPLGSSEQPATRPGVVMGTPQYMAPEQIEGQPADPRTDIFAFGLMLYEMLTGRRAFQGDSAMSTLAAILHKDPEPFGRETPHEVEKLVKRCLRKDPARRYQHMDDVKVELDELKEAPDSGRFSESSTAERRLSVIPRKWYIAAVVIVLAAALSGFGVSRWLPGWRGATARSAPRITRITTDPSSVWPAVSPDGKMVAYVARRDSQNWGIWVQHVGGGAAVRITEGFADGDIAFSADGSKIYYPSTSDPPGIYEVPVLGGGTRLAISGARNMQPSPDGKWLAYARGSTIYVQPAAGGEAREVTHGYLAPYYTSRLVWSPDSTRLLAAVQYDSGAKLVVFPLDGSKREVGSDLLENLERRGFGDLNVLRFYAWLPGGDIVFSARYGDANNLWRIPPARAGEDEPSPVTVAPWNSRMADIRGNHLVLANLRRTNQIWRLPADVNAGHVLGNPQPVTPELVEAQFPDVRRDGSVLAYISKKDGGQGVFLLDLRTGKERTLAMSDRDAAYSTFSPDGSQVAFGFGGPRWPVFVMSAAGGASRSFGDAGGRIRGWSSDGRFLLLWRARRGSQTAGVLDLTTGRITDIVKSEFPIEGARFSPDSRWIAFLSGEGDPKPRLWIAPFRGAEPVPTADWIEIAGGGTLPFWSPDGRSFYYARTKDKYQSDMIFFRQPLDRAGRPSGSPAEFYHMRGYNVPGPIMNTISATREHVYLLLNSGQSDVWLMDLPQ